MDKLLVIYAWIHMHGAMILGVMLGMSEALAQIPSIKANSVFQAIMNAMAFIKAKLVS